MSDPLSNLCAGYGILETHINLTLHTQLGGTAQLRLQCDEAFFLQQQSLVNSAPSPFPPAEFATLQQSIATMANLLDEACHLSSDPQEGPSITVVAESSTALLLLVFRSTSTKHSLTVPMLDHIPPHLVLPIPLSLMPSWMWQLAIGEILEVFPNFSRSMIASHLMASGHEMIQFSFASKPLSIVSLTTIHHWDPCRQQQLGPDCAQSLLDCHFTAWDSESHSQ
ncbi:hypothetical protein DFH08DRAFT_807001 [Mycena albidolilacea]|uniref:Uncharacterized protein n=1 Tax=Mycena albidolilacea TaxID=1033008 RepID=A0AAD7A567_9AGAR|nr:hypothetical protein DFH08DRAFT_807001 [Mycena albidolilacea]